MFLSLGRGLLTDVQPGAVFSSPPAVYVADHNTAPPPDQIIKLDPTGALVRSLQSRKAREGAGKRATKIDKGKRPAEDPPATTEGQNSAKRPGLAVSSGALGPSSSARAEPPSSSLPGPAQSEFASGQLKNKTIKDLQAILRAWGLPVSGKKDDLISRLLEKQTAAQGRQ